MIKADNLTMVYGKDTKAVDGLSFEIHPGEIVGFAGPNGAGKTTVIKMLTGILRPTGGHAFINGYDISRQALEAKRCFAYVADNPDILLQLKGVEYLDYVSDLYGVSREDRKQRIDMLSGRLGMENSLGMVMRDYSHGMRQKLMIIAALLHDPVAWILDEPMTGLDPSSSFELKQMMREHAAKGNAVLFSTHVLEVAEKLCDRIIIIDHGRLLFEGSIERLEQEHPGMDLEQIFLEMVSARTGETGSY